MRKIYRTQAEAEAAAAARSTDGAKKIRTQPESKPETEKYRKFFF